MAPFQLTPESRVYLQDGQPRYALGETAMARLGALGAETAWLSLSQEGGMAAAVCVIE